MIGILIMLNNYFHDFATAIVLVWSYSMVLMIRYVKTKGAVESKDMIVSIYPKMLHMNVAAVVFVLIAGIVRAFTYSEFEWAEAAGRGQVLAVIIKHILLFIVFFYGIYLWIGIHKTIKELRKELENIRR